MCIRDRSRTGCNILPQTAARLGRDFENIVGIKEASGNISQVAKLKKLAEMCIRDRLRRGKLRQRSCSRYLTRDRKKPMESLHRLLSR